MEIVPYKTYCKGRKLARGREKGLLVQGLVIEVLHNPKTIIIRDRENFPHSIDPNFIEIIDDEN